MKAAHARRDAGAPVRDASRTLADWCEQWTRTSLAASPRREATRTLYASLLRSHVIPSALGSITLDKLRPTDLEAWVVSLRSGLAPSSVQKVFIVLRECLDDCVRDGLLARNPAATLKQPAIPRKEARHLSRAEVDVLLEALEGTRGERVISLIAQTGLRKGEALALRWADIDLEKGTLRVSGTLARLNGRLVVSEPKTAKSRRVLPMSDGVAALLRAQRKAQAEDRLRAGSKWADSGHVFTTESGQPMDPRNVLRAFETAAKRAGLSGVNVHSLRHSAAVTMLESGIHLRGVSDMLGHSDTRITGDIYGHTSEAVSVAAMAALSSRLSSNGV